MLNRTQAPAYLLVSLLAVSCSLSSRAAEWVEYAGKTGPGRGKRIVLISGDEEYRSEQALPMLAKILAFRHGFSCRVLFPINPADGTIDPVTLTNIPGMDALDATDLCIMSLRFRELPDAQMKHFVDYLEGGKPIIALRTSTHAFAYDHNKTSPYVTYDWRSAQWPGGFGREVLGETWVDHHGAHGRESTRGIINTAFKEHPILRGVADLWVPTDVYEVAHLPGDASVLVWGQVLAGMEPNDTPVPGAKNQPMTPIVWVRQYTGAKARSSKIVTTTMGAAVDLQNEGLRRLLVNASYWAVGLENDVQAKANVDYIGPYNPAWFGFGKFAKGVKPEDLEMKP